MTKAVALVSSIRWVLALMFLGIGALAVDDWSSWRWVAVTLLLYAMPLAGQFVPRSEVRVYSIWFGVLLLLQTLATPLVVDQKYITLVPMLKQERDVQPGAIPGIEGVQKITTDQYGFRTTLNIDYRNKPANHIRIFVIGGSTTEQIFLDDQSTWTHLLQERLQVTVGSRRVEVINTGVSGLRAVHHVATLRRVSAFRPDMAIILVGVNDWNRHIVSALSPELLRERGPRTERVAEADPLRARFAFRASALGTILGRLMLGISAAGDRRSHRIPETGVYLRDKGSSLFRSDVRWFRPGTVSAEYAAAMESLADSCRELGIRCIFVTQPTAYQPAATESVKRRFWMTPPYAGYTLDFGSMMYIARLYNGFLREFAQQRGMAICDLADEMPPSAALFYDDCHFTVKGARRVAGTLSACVKRLGF